MRIGIDGSRAFIKNRTGIEEYSYQVIKSLVDKVDKNHQVFLYIRKAQSVKLKTQKFNLPDNWKFKIIYFPYLWTQVGLSLEMLFHPVDTLFIPAHTVPIIHPKNTVVTIHGLEYEFCPKAYSWWEKMYMRCSIINSCKWAKKIIAVSENTKNDLAKLYGVNVEKIKVIYEGYNRNFEFPTLPTGRQVSNFESNPNDKISKSFLLFIGRLEERKNIMGIIDAYDILKEKYNIPHELVLVGKPGYGYDKIKFKIQNSKFKISELGYITENEKWELLSKAEIFIFPTLYEGFGIPILEAQSVGVPVVTSNTSSIPEVVSPKAKPSENRRFSLRELQEENNYSAILVNPKNPNEIAQAVQEILTDENLKKDLIAKGLQNVKRFSWEKCAQQIAEVLGK